MKLFITEYGYIVNVNHISYMSGVWIYFSKDRIQVSKDDIDELCIILKDLLFVTKNGEMIIMEKIKMIKNNLIYLDNLTTSIKIKEDDFNKLNKYFIN